MRERLGEADARLERAAVFHSEEMTSAQERLGATEATLVKSMHRHGIKIGVQNSVVWIIRDLGYVIMQIKHAVCVVVETTKNHAYKLLTMSKSNLENTKSVNR